MTLLLGPPSSGKSTLLKALSGRLHKGGLKYQGEVTTEQDSASYACIPVEPPERCRLLPWERCVEAEGGQVSQVTYNGRPFSDFTVQRASTYIEQTDEHLAELTCELFPASVTPCHHCGWSMSVCSPCANV